MSEGSDTDEGYFSRRCSYLLIISVKGKAQKLHRLKLLARLHRPARVSEGGLMKTGKNLTNNLQNLGSIGFLFGIVLLLTLGAPGPLAAQTGAGQVEVIRSNSNRIVLELIPPPFQIKSKNIDGRTFSEIQVPNWGQGGEAGGPNLPVFGAMVAIPQRANALMNVRADESKIQLLDFAVAPVPLQRVTYDERNRPTSVETVFAPDPGTYSANALFPSQSVKMTSPAQWRSQRYVNVYFNPFQYNPATRELTVHQRIRIEIDFGLPENANTPEFGQTVDERDYEQIFAASFVNYAASKNWRSPRPNVLPTALKENATAAAADSYRLELNRDGIYRVTCEQLQAAGINLAGMALDTLKLTNRGNEVALAVTDVNSSNSCNTGADSFLFYGEALDTIYTGTNVYWLSFGSGLGKRMANRSASGGTWVTSFMDDKRIEKNLDFLSAIPFVEDADHWIWETVSWFVPDRDYTFQLQNPIGSDGNATLEAEFVGFTAGNHRTKLLVNGTEIKDTEWTGQTAIMMTASIPPNVLTPGMNTIRVTEVVAPGIIDTIYTNYFKITNARSFAADNNILRFRQPTNGLWKYQINGYTANDIGVFDISDTRNVARVANTTALNGGAFRTEFSDDANSPRDYFVLTSDAYRTPTIIADSPSTWRSPGNSADYIVITHNDLKNNVQPLVNYRRSTGLNVKVVDIQDIYDEFSYGIFDPRAIRDFLAYAYANWQAPKPEYVLLAGSGHFDYRGYYAAQTPLFAEPNYVPVMVKLVDPWIGMTATDNYFVALDAGSLLPSMKIGRLIATSPAEMDVLVNKVLDYEQKPPAGNWRKQVTFVSDNQYEANGVSDPAGPFFDFSEGVAGDPQLQPSPIVTNRVYYNPCTTCTFPFATIPSATVARNAVLASINNGSLIVNYVGHASTLNWAHNLLAASDATGLTNGDRLVMMLPMTCLDGYFHSPGIDVSLSEALVKRSGGGAIASWAPTGFGSAYGHDFLDRGFFEAVMQIGRTRIGDAAVLGKAKLYTESGNNLDLLETFTILGDPATNLAMPTGWVTPTPTSTLTRTPTATDTPTTTATPTYTPTDTPTSTPTITPGGPSLTPTDTPTDTPTVTETFLPTDTPTVTLTETPACLTKPKKAVPLAPANGAELVKVRPMLKWSVDSCTERVRLVIKRDARKGPRVYNGLLVGTQFKPEALERGHTYFWRLKSCNAFGCQKGRWQEFSVQFRK